MELFKKPKITACRNYNAPFCPIKFIDEYLIDDIWIVIFKYLDPVSLCMLMQTSRSFYTYILKNQLIYKSLNDYSYCHNIRLYKKSPGLKKRKYNHDILDVLIKSPNVITFYENPRYGIFDCIYYDY